MAKAAKVDERRRMTVAQIDEELGKIRPPETREPWTDIDRINVDDLLDERLGRTRGR